MSMSEGPQRNSFSSRVLDHPRVKEHWSPQDDSNGCVWAVDDQLLLTKRVSPAVRDWLADRRFEPQLLHDERAQNLPGLEAEDDVDIVQLKLPGDRDVFSVVTELRRELLREAPDDVSPNHILVPASWGNACPSGPPSEYDGAVPGPPTGGFTPQITLIDSGYQWPEEWGVNPLEALLGHQQPVIAGRWPSGTGWVDTPPEVPDGDHPSNPQRLDALGGHGNFAAGELAQRLYEPEIAIWNHNGSFVGNDLAHVPTEIAVLNTLLRSQQETQTPVILIVFAFAVFEGLPAAVWTKVLAQIERHNPNFVLVAPAGNQGSKIRRYPAALALENRRVISVASIDTLDDHCRSCFSNYGTKNDPWVTCAAIGEEVLSTFLHVDLPPEEAPEPPGSPPKPYDFAAHNSWAIWQGTSFAAPKIAAAIANELENTPDVFDAWYSLARGRQVFYNVGIKFDDLG
jgi:subtilase family protein